VGGVRLRGNNPPDRPTPRPHPRSQSHPGLDALDAPGTVCVPMNASAKLLFLAVLAVHLAPLLLLVFVAMAVAVPVVLARPA
jgi:hypothetical protein